MNQGDERYRVTVTTKVRTLSLNYYGNAYGGYLYTCVTKSVA